VDGEIRKPVKPRFTAISVERSPRGRPPTPFLRERIVASATRLFSKTDFADVTIDEVAAHARVGKGSVYRQFNSKEELYAAVVIGGFIQLQEEIRVALQTSESLDDQISTIVNHTLHFYWTRQQFFELLRKPRSVPRRVVRHFRAERERLLLLICDVLKAAAERGTVRRELDAQLAAEALLGSIRGISRHQHEYTIPAVAIQTVASLFLGGCLSPEGSRAIGAKLNFAHNAAAGR
jgi:AcrR family transcriptional regulator